MKLIHAIYWIAVKYIHKAITKTVDRKKNLMKIFVFI